MYSRIIDTVRKANIIPLSVNRKEVCGMPTITVEGPPLGDLDVKRELVKEVTDSAHKAYKLPKEVIVVVIKENGPENVSVGGELIVDRQKK